MAGAPAIAQTQTARSHSGHSHTGQTTLAYTVMGDSYSAGSGAGGETGPCRQSTAGYANDVAALTGAALTNIACSGNTITEVDRQGIYFWSNWCRRDALKRWSNLCDAPYKADENVLVTGNRLTSIGGDGIVITGVTDAVVEAARSGAVVATV